MSELGKQKRVKKVRVLVPLVPVHIYSIGSSTDKPDLVPEKTITLTDGTPDGIELVCFDNNTVVDTENTYDFEHENIILKGKPLRYRKQTIGKGGLRCFFNCALFLNYYDKTQNGIAFFPHTIEQRVSPVINLLRLFCPGDVFAPLVIVENFDISNLTHTYEENQKGMSFSQHRLEEFKTFYEYYHDLFIKVKNEIRPDNHKPLLSWAKRINNAIYFFNQSYFSRKSNAIHTDARKGNELRLIYLNTAVDALCGNYKTKDLIQNCSNLIGKMYPKVAERIEYFYDMRSWYIHADDSRMISYILDKDIDELRLYTQKMILTSLELFGSESFKQNFIRSNKKHFFDYVSSVNPQAEIKNALQKVVDKKDVYGVPHNVELLLR